jgi:hypothetical protein
VNRQVAFKFLAVLIQARGKILLPEIQKLIICIWKKEELSYHWKESIIASVHNRDDKTDCSNYREI